jgi:hypothetical protein
MNYPHTDSKDGTRSCAFWIGNKHSPPQWFYFPGAKFAVLLQPGVLMKWDGKGGTEKLEHCTSAPPLGTTRLEQGSGLVAAFHCPRLVDMNNLRAEKAVKQYRKDGRNPQTDILEQLNGKRSVEVLRWVPAKKATTKKIKSYEGYWKKVTLTRAVQGGHKVGDAKGNTSIVGTGIAREGDPKIPWTDIFPYSIVK